VVKTVLMVAAEERELRGVLRRARGVERLAWPVRFARSAELNGQRLLLVAHGPGPLAGEAAAVALDRERAGAVVSAGYCGALDPRLRTGDVVVASRVDNVNVSFDAALPHCERPCHSGVVVSIQRVAGSVEEKARLRETGALAVEMEAALVAAQAAKRGTPFFCIRAVMDEASQGFVLDYSRLRTADGRFSRARIALAALARPFTAAPELYRLERQGRIAARALGDFIADCRF
jgi:adenosylhomocysteine nucleosidase